MYLNKSLLLFFFLTAASGLCFSEETSLLQSDNKQIIKTTHENGGLVFAAPPYWGCEKTKSVLQILTEYLTQAVLQKITLVILEDYEDLVAKTESGEIDIGFYGPTIYIEAKELCPELKYIASAVLKNTNKTYYYSYLIAKKGSRLNTIEKLYGKTLAFGSTESTSGYMYPRAWMEDNNIVPDEYFSEVVYLQSHNEVLNAVLTGAVDAGIVSPTPLKFKEPVPGELFIRSRKFGPIPSSAIAVSEDLPETTVEKITAALTMMPSKISEHQEFVFSGFKQNGDCCFDQMRRVMKIISKNE